MTHRPPSRTSGRSSPTPPPTPIPCRGTPPAARIRAESPILRVALPEFPEFWAITKHADVMEIERHPDLFTNAPVPTLAPSKRVADDGRHARCKTLIQMDGDRHKAHRNIVNDWFKPGNVKKMQDRIDELARQSVDQMAALGGECDFVNDVALHYPAAGDPLDPRPPEPTTTAACCSSPRSCSAPRIPTSRA